MRKKALFFTFIAFLLASCSSSSTKAEYDPYEDWPECQNIYKGNKDEFHLSHWYASDYGQIEVKENDEQVDVEYSKAVEFEYTYLYTTVQGRLADFYYLNFLAKGTPGKGICFRLFYGQSEKEANNVLGNDISFSLSEEYSWHALKIKGTYLTRMDLLSKVCIYPEIGLSGTEIHGEFSFRDVYFSKEIHEGGHLENPGVDSGDTSVNVNGWKTQAWTQYTLYDVGSSRTGVRYSKAADWAYIERDIVLEDDQNALRFRFQNLLSSNRLSISTIHFLLRGDVARHVDEGVEYEYDEYYSGEFYTYNNISKEDEVAPDENGIITLELPLASALSQIGEGNYENGLRLVLMIESNPEDAYMYRRYRDGQMIIESVEFYHGEFVFDPYSQYGEAVYTLSDKEGVEKNITYSHVDGASFWPRIRRDVELANHDSIIHLVLRNNGENMVRIGIHAGRANDARSDQNNQYVYPLWKTEGLRNEEGYFVDGGDYDIAPGGTENILISVDSTSENIRETDAINVVQFLVDSCYGGEKGKNFYSGDIDIVSFEVNNP